MKFSNTLIPIIIYWFTIFNPVSGIGMFIDPALKGDKSKYSSLKNLKHCISYSTTNNDLIMIKVNSGEKSESQSLNLKIFDSEDNLLRFQEDLSEEITLILKNLNDPLIDQKTTRSNIVDKISNFGTKENPEKLNALLNIDKGKNRIYVCFDNLYSDKSWSFKPQIKEIELDVHLRDISLMKSTDYNLYSKYFNKFISGDDHRLKNMNEKDFENEIHVIENELSNVVENLENSELLLKNIIQQESQLRDANEDIFSVHTLSSVSIVVVIVVLGICHTVYLRYYLSKKIQ